MAPPFPVPAASPECLPWAEHARHAGRWDEGSGAGLGTRLGTLLQLCCAESHPLDAPAYPCWKGTKSISIASPISAK